MGAPLVLLALAAQVAACRATPAVPPPEGSASAVASAPDGSAAGHSHDAPHGGVLVELGEEFAHLEVVLDASSGRLTVYMLDGTAERAIRVEATALPVDVERPGGPALAVSLPAVANPLTGETAGDSSQFEAVVPELRHASGFSATVPRVTVRGRVFNDVRIDYPAGGH